MMLLKMHGMLFNFLELNINAILERDFRNTSRRSSALINFLVLQLFASVLTAVLMSLKGVPKSIWERIIRITTYKATVYQTEGLYYHLTQWFNVKP